MDFSQFFLRLALAVSVTLAVTKDEDPLTITCQNIRHDSTFEFEALEMRNSNEISLENCTIDTPSNNKLRCSSCSVLEIGRGLWKGKIVSETVRLDSMKPHERTKRQGDAETPLHTSSNERVLQTGHTYQLPCPVFAPGDVIADIIWFRGSSCYQGKRQLILQHHNPPGGTVISLTPHYQFTDTNYGLVIESATQTDSDRYWCKASKDSIGKYEEDFLDLIVLGKRFPMHRWPNTVGDIQSITVNFKEENVVTCPVMSQTGSRLVDVTVYWSRLNTSTDDSQSMDIVFPDNGVATTDGRYSLDTSNNLVVNKFNDREEMYCCHVFQDGIYPRQSCVRVVWTAIQEQRYPVISGCGNVTTPEDQCDVKLESRQEFFQLECFVNSVYPRPEVSWSVTDCEGKNAIGFSTCNDWTFDDVSMTYNATSKLYLHNFPLKSISCTFNCTSLGGAIANDKKFSSVQISRGGVVEAQCSCNCVLVFILTVIFMTFWGSMVIACLLKVVSARKRRFIVDEEKCSRIATQMVPPQSENAQNSTIEGQKEDDEGTGSAHMESSPMMSQGNKSNANVNLKGRDHHVLTSKYIIYGKAVEEESFHSGGVVVRGDKLFLVNKLDDDNNLQVLQRNEVGGGEEHRFIVAVSEDEAGTVMSRGIKGVTFVDVDEILVYFDDAVYIFKKTDKILPSNK